VLRDGERYVSLHPHLGFAHKIIADAAYQVANWALDRKHLILALQLDPEFKHSYLNIRKLDPRFAELPPGWLPPEEIWD